MFQIQVKNSHGEWVRQGKECSSLREAEAELQVHVRVGLERQQEAAMTHRTIMPPAEGLALRPAVAAFAQAMERKLRENDYKGGWRQCSRTYLVERLIEESDELAEASATHRVRGVWVEASMEYVHPVEILDEAADVANFAMMIADVCGGLPERAPVGDTDGAEGEEK